MDHDVVEGPQETWTFRCAALVSASFQEQLPQQNGHKSFLVHISAGELSEDKIVALKFLQSY